jgi:hypothetical protein
MLLYLDSKADSSISLDSVLASHEEEATARNTFPVLLILPGTTF